MLAAASEENSLDIVKALLAKGADTTLKDSVGNTALDYARLREDTGAVSLIKQANNK